MNLIPKKEKTRYRIISIDNHFIVLDCLKDRVWRPFHKTWEAQKFIETITEKTKAPAKFSDCGDNPGFRALVETKAEYIGKPKKDSIKQDSWAELFKNKRLELKYKKI
jgi:hypothetical protein